MKIVTTNGLLVGVVVWVMYEVLIISNSSCAKLSNCGGWEMLLGNLVAIGGLAPAWLAGSLFDEISKKNYKISKEIANGNSNEPTPDIEKIDWLNEGLDTKKNKKTLLILFFVIVTFALVFFIFHYVEKPVDKKRGYTPEELGVQPSGSIDGSKGRDFSAELFGVKTNQDTQKSK